MMDFDKRYAKLNKAQKLAVDTVDGPVMVIAGPGTGKTELLSVRTANILQKTDTLPENILCLTFTDSGANAMRQRLTEIIGKDAYKVTVHTFHSFGREVINQNRQFFYQGAHFMLADRLSSYEIVQDILKDLDYNNPLSSKLNNEYTHLSDILTSISEIKKSGLTSDELLAVLDENNAVIEKTEQLIAPIFASRITKNTSTQVEKHIMAIKQSGQPDSISTVVPLATVLADSLENAVNEAISQNSTKPITAWRNAWFKKDEKDNFILKSRERQVKLRALCFVYEKYMSTMQAASLYDFDDMILQVVHAMEIFNDLRFNLQEKYQYVMVDEFQDTNMSQMRILHNLTNNVAHGDTPNILVVGDDDQAIYSFQGADISNIISFHDNYPKSIQITLTENYRSNTDILNSSREVILQGVDRLENTIEGPDKQLTSLVKSSDQSVFLHQAESIFDERHFIVNDIKERIKLGEKPNSIAVLTRRHKDIDSLLPYFSQAGISVNYERRDNVLDIEPVKFIQHLGQLLIDISNGDHDDVNANLPEILAHKMWKINPKQLWELSIKAYDKRVRWLDAMANIAEFVPLHDWLISTALLTVSTPLEQMLDVIVGKPNSSDDTNDSDFVSPAYNYFFGHDKINTNPNEYLTYLESLRTIRLKIREYHPKTTPTLSTFIEFIALNQKIGNTISITRRIVQSESAVNIMTAHKSKGLEFDTIYVINAVDTVWGQRARNRNRLINYTENLPLAPAGESFDEKLRLFYVAITRAKHQLNISYSLTDDNGNNTLRASFLVNSTMSFHQIPPPKTTDQLIQSVEAAWYQPIVSPATNQMPDLLKPLLENYKLSVTHLHSFLDITRGGPATFLLKNLLRFPQAKSSNAAFGTAIHDTLQNAHSHLVSTGKRLAVEDIVSNFERNLDNQRMNQTDFHDFLKKGNQALQVFFNKKYDSFTPTQQTELSFANQHSVVGYAHLNGKIDMADVDLINKTISVTDYKTGKPSHNWTGKTDYEKIKLHKYKQQLLFYKLLVENARDYRSYKVDNGVIQFVEPTTSGDIVSLNINYETVEIEQFSKLINTVWTHITNLNLPDISRYEASYKGVIAFEQDLIDGVI